MQKPDFKTLQEFYPYYLTQHLHPVARALHFTGTGLLFPIVGYMFYTQNWWLFFLLPVVGYGFAWTGHAFFEKNKPAAFSNPLWSLASDFIMFKDILTGQITAKIDAAKAESAQKGWA
jgi:hypothetical protein